MMDYNAIYRASSTTEMFIRRENAQIVTHGRSSLNEQKTKLDRSTDDAVTHHILTKPSRKRQYYVLNSFCFVFKSYINT